MPAAEGLRSHDRDGLQDRRKPAIQLNEKQAVAIGEPDAGARSALQHNQLISKDRVLSPKPAPGLEDRGERGQAETYQCDHRTLTVGHSVTQSIRMRFSV